MNDTALPIAFAAKNCVKLRTAPNGKEEYWSADIKAVRHELFVKVFENVLFVETPGEMVFLAGIEHEDGIDRHLQPARASEQAAFIQFLRDENARDTRTLGPLAGLFEGHGYATVGKATAAYMAARGLTHPFGVGYADADDGQYKHLGLRPGEDFDGTRYLPFDELGEPY